MQPPNLPFFQPHPDFNYIVKQLETLISNTKDIKNLEQGLRISKRASLSTYASVKKVIEGVSGWLYVFPDQEACSFTHFRKDLPVLHDASDRVRKVFEVDFVSFICKRTSEGSYTLQEIHRIREVVKRAIVRVACNVPHEKRDKTFLKEVMDHRNAESVARKYRVHFPKNVVGEYKFYPFLNRGDHGLVEMRQEKYIKDLSDPTIPMGVAISMLRQTCDVVKVMHENEGIHCDLTLKNIFVDSANNAHVGDLELFQSEFKRSYINQNYNNWPDRETFHTIFTDIWSLTMDLAILLFGVPFKEAFKFNHVHMIGFLQKQITFESFSGGTVRSKRAVLFGAWLTRVLEARRQMASSLDGMFNEHQTLREYLRSKDSTYNCFESFVVEFRKKVPPLTDFMKLLDDLIPHC